MPTQPQESSKPPIEMVPCIKCGKPSMYQNVEGGWCISCWPQSKTMSPKTKEIEVGKATVLLLLRESGFAPYEANRIISSRETSDKLLLTVELDP